MREYKSRCATLSWRLIRLRAGDSIASLNVSRPFNIVAISGGNNSSKNAGMVTTVSIRQGDDFNHPFRLGNQNTAGFVASLARESTVRN